MLTAASNWFVPDDINRDYGEVASIRQMVAALIDRYPIDHSRVFVTGLSAGGAMAAAMLAAYPEVFAAGAIVRRAALRMCEQRTAGVRADARTRPSIGKPRRQPDPQRIAASRAVASAIGVARDGRSDRCGYERRRDFGSVA